MSQADKGLFGAHKHIGNRLLFFFQLWDVRFSSSSRSQGVHWLLDVVI